MEDNPVILKISLLGKTFTGKSALIFRYVSEEYFNKEHEKTIEDLFTIKENIEDIECQIKFSDTGGDKDYESMEDSWINSSDGFILVYSIDSKDTYEKCKNLFQKIKGIKGENFMKNISVSVIGNKSDLDQKRQVKREDAEKFCDKNNLIFIETSAKENINIKEAFKSAAKDLLKKKYPELIKDQTNNGKSRCYCF